MKIGRNSLCPCGSGRKYKFCCINKNEQQKYFEAVVSASSDLKNEARIKKCLHPDTKNCDSKIVKAHAIQNNRILNKLSVDGDVMTTDGQLHLIFQNVQKKGRKAATTFSGFCSYHDKTTFQEIEDRDFFCTNKQIFLFTYRTLAWHYQKKLEQNNAQYIMGNRMFDLGYDFRENSSMKEIENSFLEGASDNEIELREFNTALINENYEEVQYIIWEIPYEVNFAISMMHELEYDIEGKQINDLRMNQRPKKIYLNIFPEKGKSFCIWSWLKNCEDVYLRFGRQFSSLSINDKENYFNNNLPRWSDSIILSPKLWNSWAEEIQKAFISHANFDILYRLFEEKEKHDYKYSYTPWNLFMELS